MKLLWTKSDNIVDKLIKTMTGEDCAHFAILFESVHGTGVVFESNLLGTRITYYQNWVAGRTIVHSIDFNLTDAQEDKVWDTWVSFFDGRGYDFWGALYLGLCKWRKRIFGTPIPTTNAWSRRNTFFCDMIYQALQGIDVFPVIDSRTNGMDTPHDIWEAIQKAMVKLPEGVGP